MDSDYFAEYTSADPPYVTEDYEKNKMLDQSIKSKSDKSDIINYLDISDEDKEDILRGLPVEKPGRFASIFNNDYNPTLPIQTGSKSLEQALNKNNITGTKRNCLIKLAKLESGMNQFAKANGSTASGMFQMIDSTRRSVSSVSKMEFMNNLDEQVKAASKLYDKNLAYLKNNDLLSKAKSKGLSTDEAVALTWLNPQWATSWLRGGSEGGRDANGTGIKKYLQLYRSK